MRKILASLALILVFGCSALAAAYNAKPKLAVVIIVDQLRGDLMERHYSDFGPGGFRLFMDRGAWFSNAYYQYANTRTCPGHATLGTGTYTLGHGILANDWWDPQAKKVVSCTEDPAEQPVGAASRDRGDSPRRLLTTTIGDELKLATSGRARVYGVALKARSAIMPVGYSADGAFWIEHDTGAFLSSTYYMKEAPAWLTAFNAAKPAAKYEGLEWKDRAGKVMRSTGPQQENGKPLDYYERIGRTPYANDYTLEFTRALIENEKLGTGPATDLLTVSFSSHDILQHKVGPDSEQEREMIVALDRQLAGFFQYLVKRYGEGNFLLALSADHGTAPLPSFASTLRIPAANLKRPDVVNELNAAISKKLGREAKYVVRYDYPNAQLDTAAFEGTNLTQAEAERTVGEAMVQLGMRNYFTKSQLASGDVPNTVFTRQFLNAYSPHSGWYVIGYSAPFIVGWGAGTDHALPYSYDTHVPVAFYGPQFRPGQYRTAAEPVDLAVTLSSVLGISKPASAVGRVLTEAIADQPRVPVATGGRR
ncbi:MAG TPA: alkaline phosphatase family protein [Clostridia bacterium]|nr:alkaline phosphatase family protein [Clostridia bacterium]